MSEWDIYQNRIKARGGTKRESMLNQQTHMLRNKLQDNLSFKTVTIDDVEQDVAIVSSAKLTEKYIYSLPSEDIKHGGIVHWMNTHWIITEKDADNTLYSKCKMIQCNHLLKWISDDGVIHEQWCMIEDGTKYLTGEYEDRQFIVTRGDSRIAMTIPRNEYTVKLGRKNRFLIDDDESGTKLSYVLSKPLKVGLTFDDAGVFKFVLQEATSTDDDNLELGIADYYKYFPKQNVTENNDMAPGDNPPEETGKKVWL